MGAYGNTDQASKTDTIAPTAQLGPVSSPRNTAVSQISATFTEVVSGFNLADLQLTLNGVPVALTGVASLTTSDNLQWTLGNLSSLTGAAGTYSLVLTATGSGIVDTAGNPLIQDATDTWTVDMTPPTVTNVLVRGSTWTSGFTSYLATLNSRNVSGYSIPVGSGSQLLTLPWANIDQIKVVFSENVVVDQGISCWMA